MSISKSDLAVEVKKRQKFLTRIDRFVKKLLLARSKVLHSEMYSFHYRLTRELNNFGSFSFWHDSGRTMFGGDEVKVFYIHNQNVQLVLHFYYQRGVEEDCQIYHYEDSISWEPKLARVMGNWRRILARVSMSEKAEKEKNRRVGVERVNSETLLTKAQRLGLR